MAQHNTPAPPPEERAPSGEREEWPFGRNDPEDDGPYVACHRCGVKHPEGFPHKCRPSADATVGDEARQPELTGRLVFSASVVDALWRDRTDDLLPEWFNADWLRDDLAPLLREALKAISGGAGAECAECARLREALRWWDAAILYPPFTPDGNGGNDGIVRDANGGFVADTRGFEARADVIAELLNRAALRAPSTQREE